MKTFVFGAKGMVGHSVVEGLLAKGHTVYAGTRSPDVADAKFRKDPNLNLVKADASHSGAGTDILSSVDAAFFLSPPGFPDQHAVLGPWLQAAVRAKLKKVVLMTAMGIGNAPPEVPFRRLEIELEKSGLPYGILRPNWFMQNFYTFWIHGIKADGKIYFPGGKGKVSFIDTRDIASCAVEMLTGDSWNGHAIDITGPESIDHDDVATKLSKASGRSIGYVDLSPDDFLKGLLGGGVPEDYARFLVMITAAVRDGHAAAITDGVKKITGKEPIGFDRFANEHAAMWK